MDRRDVDVVPILEIFAKQLGISSLGGVIHLFVDRRVELTEHPRPIGVFIKLRKALGKFRDLFQDHDVAADRRFEIWTLNFYRNLFTAVQTGAIDLAERSGGDRFEFELGIDLRDLAAQLTLDDRKRNIVRKRRNLVDQGSKFFDKRQRQQIGPRAHRLAHFDKRRAESYEFIF